MKDGLGNRMKGYEAVSRNFLTRRMPVIIRLDGKAFHTFTKGLNKPFDDILTRSMWETARFLCQNIQGCKIAYTQSDEISLLLVDYDNLDTCAWFDNNVQKMTSVSASMATLVFNKSFQKLVDEISYTVNDDDEADYLERLQSKINTAMFDSRVFNIPKEEVNNYFLWRQNDATRNSIQMLGQSQFSHKELYKKSCDDIQKFLLSEKDINWNNLPTYEKRGACINKEKYMLDGTDTLRHRWYRYFKA